MAKSFVDLSVRDNGFNAKIKGVINTFASLGNAASGAKGQFTKFADSISQVAQSQQLLNSALKGNPYGLLMQAATTAFTKIIEKATEATDAEKRAMEWAEKRAETEQTAAEAIGRSTGDLMAKYEMLRIEWNNLSTDQQKNDWIKQNQNAFKGLNLAVTDVTSAENVFVNNTSKVVAALKARAEAEAYADLYKDQIKKNAMNKATGKYNSKVVTSTYRPTIREAELAGLTNEDYEHRTRKVMGRDGKYHDYIERTDRLMPSGVSKMNSLFAMGGASRENADRMQAEYWANMMGQAQANANALSANGLFGYTPRGGSGGGRSGGGAGGEKDDFTEMRELTGLIEIQEQKVKDLKEMIRQAPEESLIATLRDQLKEAQAELDRLNGKVQETGSTISSDMNPPLVQMENVLKQLKEDLNNAATPEAYQNILSDIKAINAEMATFKGENPVTKMEKDAKGADKSFSQAAGAISAVGNALNSIDDPTAKIMGIVAQAIATIAQGFATATSASAGGGVFAWIASLAAGGAAMMSAIGAIHSATGYAMGGVIPGNSYSGDNQWARVNAGETILTRAQAGLLADALTRPESEPQQPYLMGDMIFLGVNNYTRASGQGEIVTTSMLRRMGIM